jgi:hypothetical protein
LHVTEILPYQTPAIIERINPPKNRKSQLRRRLFFGHLSVSKPKNFLRLHQPLAFKGQQLNNPEREWRIFGSSGRQISTIKNLLTYAAVPSNPLKLDGSGLRMDKMKL